MISRTNPEREIYEARLKARRDAAAERQDARDAGLAEGRAEGRAEMQRGNIQSLQEALGQDVTPLEGLRALPLDDLESIWSRLKAALHAKLNDRK